MTSDQRRIPELELINRASIQEYQQVKTEMCELKAFASKLI
jgi:hypothetical protein